MVPWTGVGTANVQPHDAGRLCDGHRRRPHSDDFR